MSARISAFDLENRVFRIAATNSKSKRIRSVPLNDAALEIIKIQMMEINGKSDYLFANPKTGLPITDITGPWMRLRGLAGLDHLRLHDLRHSFASMLVNSGRTLYEVQQILGHSQPIVTQRYAHLSSKTLQSASNCASAIIQNAMQARVQAVAVEAIPELLEVKAA